MLYFLLTIIAIGVLLASEAGQLILGCLVILLGIGVLLFLGFWVVVTAIGFLSDKGTQDTISTILGFVFLTCLAIGGIIVIYKNYKQGKLSKQTIKAETTEIWKQHFSKQAVKAKIIKHWKQRQLWVIFWVITSLAIIYLCVTGNIK